MSFSLAPSNYNYPTTLNLSSSQIVSRYNGAKISWRAITVCYGAKTRLSLLRAARAEQNPDSTTAHLDHEHEEKKVKDGKDEKEGFSLQKMISWMLKSSWFLGSIFFMAVPFYKRILYIEDQVVKTSTMALDAVEKMAEVTDKMAENFGKNLPENSRLKKLVSTVEKIAEEVDKDAELVESLVKKVDDVVDEFDRMLEPIIEGSDDKKETKHH